MALGVYIQVPFCQTKCTYCNFHTGVVSRDRYEPYASAICREISASPFPAVGARHAVPDRAILTGSSEFGGSVTEGGAPQNPLASADSAARPDSIDTIYFGGGTPSLLESQSLANILIALASAYRFVEPEVTLEADPETIASEKAGAWRTAGFNRISLGVQSFNDRELQATGRMHRCADIDRAADILRASGFDNISMDLIAGLPHQTRESWECSMAEILRLRPEHISIYMLEIDEGSHLGKESLAGGARYSAAAIPPDDAQAEYYESACARLAAEGYDHYEISNWALPGRRSRHNQKYWQRLPYLGLGAGAHSFNGAIRWANVHDSARYVAAIEQGISPREQIERVTSEQALEEEFFLGLRQLEGVDLARIERDHATNGNGTSIRLATIRTQIESLRTQGLVALDGDRLRLSPNHLTISSSVLAELLR
ncbi:MAG: radical SAM family heme chaperone HemW [Candidatus Acidiferrales bacterium]